MFVDADVFDLESSLRFRLATKGHLLVRKGAVAAGATLFRDGSTQMKCPDRLVVAFLKVPLSESPGTSGPLVDAAGRRTSSTLTRELCFSLGLSLSLLL